MKLYIPTTSLNFNNILSTESISPKEFYADRGFGYSRWFSIPENNFRWTILLYESPAQIVRKESDQEDHPLMIELDTEENFPILREGVRYSTHTIYLDPWHTRFIFQEERDKTVTLSLSDASLETKMCRLYQKWIDVKQYSESFPSLDGIEEPTENRESLEYDLPVNKMKGLLYGYYIGANLSTSKEEVERLNTLRDILNIFAAINSSVDKNPTENQLKRLENHSYFFRKEEPCYKEILRETGSEQTTNNIIAIVERYCSGLSLGFYSEFKRIVDSLKHGTNEPNYAISWIKSKIEGQQQKISKSKHLLQTDKSEIIVMGRKLSQIPYISNEDENKLYTSWVNEILSQPQYYGKVSTIKEDLTDALTKSARETLGERWDSSPIRTYLNQLRRHVRGEEFNQPWTNGVLSSIAAVILKGDEWETLLNFMQAKGMTDYRLAFSFYGILNGFANLTRDFTDMLLQQDSTYVSDVYREFHGQLHDISIRTNKETNHPSQNLQPTNIEQESTLESSCVQNSSESVFRDAFRSIAPKTGSKRKNLEDGLQQCLEKHKNKLDAQEIILDLPNFGSGWKKENTPWKNMRDLLCPSYKEEKSPRRRAKKNVQSQELSFDSDQKWNQDRYAMQAKTQAEVTSSMAGPTTLGDTPTPVVKNAQIGNILQDKKWIDETSQCIKNQKSRDQYKKDITWFIDQHSEYPKENKKDKKGCYFGKAQDNSSVLKRLEKFLKPRKSSAGDNKWIADLYQNIPVEEILELIQKKFND